MESLENIFKYSKHFLRNVNPEIISKFGFSTRPIFRLLKGSKFTFRSAIHDSNTLCSYGDIICGLYFPNNEPGDVVSIIIRKKIISTLTIDDNKRIYLPINDLLYLPLVNLPYVKIDCPKKFYCIYMLLKKNEKDFIFNTKNQGLYFNKQIYNFFFQSFDTDIKRCQNSFQMIYYSNVIKRFFRKCVL